MQDSNNSPSTLRIGHVTDFDPAALRARVNFPELGITSHWLPLLVMNSLKTHDECFLDEGEHVACLMQGTGAESGFILGAIYDDKNKPRNHDKDKRTVKFDDGTTITYDRKEHVLELSGPELVTVKAEKVNVKAESITLSAGSILLDGGHINLDGSVTCPGYCRC